MYGLSEVVSDGQSGLLGPRMTAGSNRSAVLSTSDVLQLLTLCGAPKIPLFCTLFGYAMERG